MQGFHNRGGVDIPEWATSLKGYYWRIRVEGRNIVLKRRFYRYVTKEKLRLAEQGIDQAKIKAVCRYLANFNPKSGDKFHALMTTEPKQFSFDFEITKSPS